jgi:hypothetical protein
MFFHEKEEMQKNTNTKTQRSVAVRKKIFFWQKKKSKNIVKNEKNSDCSRKTKQNKTKTTEESIKINMTIFEIESIVHHENNRANISPSLRLVFLFDHPLKKLLPESEKHLSSSSSSC